MCTRISIYFLDNNAAVTVKLKNGFDNTPSGLKSEKISVKAYYEAFEDLVLVKLIFLGGT